MQKDALVVRFFDEHPWLLEDPRFRKEATARLGTARRSLAAKKARAERARAKLERDSERRQLAAALERSPEKAICHIFGPHCRQALQVAHCESGYRTTAQNGQYLGIFQMGSSERRQFGHGSTALEQAQAAYRYFVLSGRDWSPWSCKPAY